MPKVTNAFTTYQAKGNREDLADAIFNIDPVDTIFISMSDTRSLKNVMFDWQTEHLPAVNGSNAEVEGFQLNRTAATATVRLHNIAQISKRDATVSNTQQEADAAGKGDEMSHQMALAGKALKRDMETVLLSNHAYNTGVDDTVARTTRGFEHWITTNAFYGATGSNPPSETAPGTPGTPRQMTEMMLADAIQQTYDGGGEPDILLMGSYNKRVFSTFIGRRNSRIAIEPDQILAAADFYLSDFGELKAYPSRYISKPTVIGWDQDYTKVGYYRKMEKIDIGTIGDATTKMIVSEYGLECSNEAAHFKLADLTYSGPITLPTGLETRVVPGATIGGMFGTAATGGDPAPDPAAKAEPASNGNKAKGGGTSGGSAPGSAF